MTTPLMVLLTLACSGDAETTGTSTPDPDATVPASEYDIDLDGHQAQDDCNDYDAAIYPGADELCGDGIDNNCDGEIDEPTAVDADDWYADDDGDGFGAGDAVAACEAPSGHVGGDGDCDDTDEDTNPLASELCDGADNDCDDDIDESTDEDSDGYDALCDGDCDDDDADVNPDGIEVCDDKDNDCNGEIDGADAAEAVNRWLDDDGDTYGDPDTLVLVCADDAGLGYVDRAGDCDDTDADRYPGNTEVCDGAVDEDCDLLVDEGLTTAYYADADGDGYGTDVSGADYCDDPGTGYSTAGGDCDEADTAVNPGVAEVCNDWTDNDCDGTDNGCTPAGALAIGSADITVLAAADSEWLGFSLAAGDITGDGSNEVLCGSVKADENSSDSGAAYAFSGSSAGGDVDDADVTLLPNAGVNGLSGRGLAVGDIDDDGQADVALGSYGAQEVVLFLGPVSGTPTIDVLISNDGGENLKFGIEVALGDLDGDGHDDLAVGASSYTNSASAGTGEDGAVYVYYGPLADAILAETDADAILEGPIGGGQAGGWLRFVGDVLGAGSETLAIGARYNDDSASNAGTVYLVTGTYSGLVDLDTADAIIQGANADDNLWHADGGGDLDGDGADDLVLGAYVADDNVNNGGALYAFYGPLAGVLDAADNDFAIYGDQSGGGMGYDIGFAGDVDGDGNEDLIAGAPYQDGSGASPGQAHVFYGPFSGDVNSSDAGVTIGPGTNSDFLGGAVLGVGDMNGDGYDDFALGDYAEDSVGADGGACYVVFGGGI